ncbi:T7SS effector LXG polymorphic toxin [Psychrobacillus psychrodurans]|uniref:T7SS effector LXG polymorphic toxin n=1 Tax=Psychrobacillus psychrodurans TaxID=126157 RepID=UPI003CFDAAF4
MKILDVDLFQDGIQRNITMLDRLSSEMKAIHHAVEGLVQMEDQLKGAGGNAIRSFYQECHLPFLHFFQLFSEQFKQVLNQMEAALHSLEPDSSGYILETFLEGELEQGLTLISELTASLTDEANSIMDQVSDIVALPHLDDSGVQEGVISSKRKRDDTLMQLYEFDALQTYALNPIEQGLQTMDTWLTDMEGLFQAGVKDINFLPSQWDVLTFRSDIRTELFPKVFLDPNYLWVREQEQLIGAMITAPTFQAMHGKKVKTIEENVAENVKYHAYDNGLLIKEYVVGQTVFYEVVSKVEYKEEETVKVDKPKENKILDSLQFGLDIAGLIPVVGEIADGANGLIYTARGDALNATLSFSAMIPVVGMASTGGKLAVKGSKAIEEAQDASKAVDNVNDGAKGIEKGKNIKDYKKTFFNEYPDLKGSVVVHHAIEQQILKRHPNIFSLEEIHALENLRGIPKEINSDIHLSKIRRDWNRFYRNNPNPTKEEVINYMIELDKKYGGNFNPPVKR